MRFQRQMLAYLWPLPYTLLGIAIGLLMGGRFRTVDGVIEIHGPTIDRLLRSLPVSPLALTLGHLVFGRTAIALRSTRVHERVHVRQYERWGLLFVPAYLAASMAISVRGRDGYRENPFEVEAFTVSDQATKTASFSIIRDSNMRCC